MPGPGELIIILCIVLVIFGAGKLPMIGDALGKTIKNFKRASVADDEIEVNKTASLSSAKSSKELDSSSSDDGEFEEVVVRRRIKKDVAS
jgi:sec-independent protein translocase protein TatA